LALVGEKNLWDRMQAVVAAFETGLVLPGRATADAPHKHCGGAAGHRHRRPIATS
jgi:hypothetical protein